MRAAAVAWLRCARRAPGSLGVGLVVGTGIVLWLARDRWRRS